MSELSVENKFVTLNGVMGSGKTTQARLLAAATKAELLIGGESDQPEIVSGKLHTQGSDIKAERWFVEFHARKLAAYQTIPQAGLVSDMNVQSDLIWARALLTGPELDEFEAYYYERVGTTVKPDCAVLFLLPSLILLERVRRRLAFEPNRQFEAGTTQEFIDQVQDSFIQSSRELGRRVITIDLRNTPHMPKHDVAFEVQQALAE